MTASRCPICEKPVDSKETTTFPFCSSRCRQIDLSRWLGESYRVTAEDDGDSDEDSPD